MGMICIFFVNIKQSINRITEINTFFFNKYLGPFVQIVATVEEMNEVNMWKAALMYDTLALLWVLLWIY